MDKKQPRVIAHPDITPEQLQLATERALEFHKLTPSRIEEVLRMLSAMKNGTALFAQSKLNGQDVVTIGEIDPDTGKVTPLAILGGDLRISGRLKQLSSDDTTIEQRPVGVAMPPLLYFAARLSEEGCGDPNCTNCGPSKGERKAAEGQAAGLFSKLMAKPANDEPPQADAA